MGIRRDGARTVLSFSSKERLPRGVSEHEPLKNIHDAVHMVVESVLEHGEHIREEPADQVEVTVEPRVAITV